MHIIPWGNKRRDADPGPRSLARLGDTLENMFDRFWRDPFGSAIPASLREEWANWGPALDLSETDQEICARFELPGLKPEDIDVNVAGQILTVRGQKREEREQKARGGYQYSERRYGEFSRSVTLPARVDPDKVNATYRDGVLTVTCLKDPASQARRIQVNRGEQPEGAGGP